MKYGYKSVTSIARWLAFAVVGVLVLSQLSAGAKGPTAAERTRNAAKARDAFVEAMKLQATGDLDGCINLLNYAYWLNPDDNDIKFENGYMLALVNGYFSDTTATRNSLAMMEEAVLDNPAHTDRGLRYIGVLSKFPWRAGSTEHLLSVLSRLYSAASDRTLVASTYAAMLRSSNNVDSIHKSIAILDSLEYIEGPSQEITTSKVQAYIALADTAASLAEVRKLYFRDPENFDNLMMLGLSNELYNRGDSAIYWYDRGLSLFPDEPDFYMRKALYFVEHADTTSAVAVLTDAAASPELDYEVKGEIVKYFASNHLSSNFVFLLDPLKTLTLSYPDKADPYLDYAAVLAMTGDTLSALNQLAEVRRVAPDNIGGYTIAANYLNTCGRSEEAITVASDGIDKVDAPLILRQYVIYLYFANNKYKDVIPLLNEMIAELNRGFDLDSALQAANANEIVDSVNVSLADSVSEFTIDDGDYVEEEPYEEIAPDTFAVDTLHMLGELYIQRGDALMKLERVKAARSDYELALKIMPNYWLTYNNYSYMLAERGLDLDYALKMAQKSMELVENEYPDSFTSIADTYAWVRYKRGEYLQAKDLIDQVLEAESTPSAEIFDHAGDIYKALGETEAAVGFWRQALDLEPDNADIKAKYDANYKPEADE